MNFLSPRVLFVEKKDVIAPINEALKDDRWKNDKSMVAALTNWKKIIAQDEWHHAWPKWMMGEAEPDIYLYLPRCLHNFDGAKGNRMAFHQAFNAKFATAYGTKKEDGGPELKVNDAAGFATYLKDAPKRGETRTEVIAAVRDMLDQSFEQAIGSKTGTLLDKIKEITKDSMGKDLKKFEAANS